MPGFLTGALGVSLQRELGISVQQLGAAVTAFFAMSAIGAAALARAGQRWGAPRAIRAGALTTGVSMGLIALTVQSFGAFVACLAVAGAANGLSQPAVNALLSGRMPRHRLGLVFGLKQSAVPIAVLLSGLSVPLLALTAGWRAVFGVGAAMAFGVAVALTDVPATRTVRASHAATNRRLLITLGVAGGFGALAASGLTAFLVSSAVSTGISQASAGTLLAASSSVAILVRLIAGRQADRSRGDGLGSVVVLLAAGAVGYAALTSSTPWLFVAGSVVAFGAGWGWPGLYFFGVVSHNPTAPGVATSIAHTGTYVGAASGPLVFGAFAQASYALAWVAMAVSALLGAAVAEGVRRAIAD